MIYLYFKAFILFFQFCRDLEKRKYIDFQPFKVSNGASPFVTFPFVLIFISFLFFSILQKRRPKFIYLVTYNSSKLHT